METKKLKKGELFTIRFKGLATAGYLWQYKADNEKLVAVKKDFAPIPAANKKSAGASADEVFTIKAEEKGTVTIHFFQKRSWEDKSTAPADEKILKLVIA